MNKKFYWIIGGIVVGLLIGTGIYFAQQDRLPKDAILYKDPQLTDQEKQASRDKIADWQRQLEDSSKSPEDRYKLNTQIGLEYGVLGEYEPAREYLLAATKILPDNATAWSQLYVIENLMMAYERAHEDIGKAIELNSTNTQFWTWRLELEQGPLQLEAEELENSFQEALRLTSEHGDILALYAKFLESQNDLPGAVQQLRKAIEKNPANKTLYEQEIVRIQAKVQ